MKTRMLIKGLICSFPPRWPVFESLENKAVQRDNRSTYRDQDRLLPPTAGSTNNCLSVNNNDYPFRSQTQAPAISASLAPSFSNFRGVKNCSVRSPFPEAAMQMSLVGEPCFQNVKGNEIQSYLTLPTQTKENYPNGLGRLPFRQSTELFHSWNSNKNSEQKQPEYKELSNYLISQTPEYCFVCYIE